jgi:hypothetical protein
MSRPFTHATSVVVPVMYDAARSSSCRSGRCRSPSRRCTRRTHPTRARRAPSQAGDRRPRRRVDRDVGGPLDRRPVDPVEPRPGDDHRHHRLHARRSSDPCGQQRELELLGEHVDALARPEPRAVAVRPIEEHLTGALVPHLLRLPDQILRVQRPFRDLTRVVLLRLEELHARAALPAAATEVLRVEHERPAVQREVPLAGHRAACAAAAVERMTRVVTSPLTNAADSDRRHADARLLHGRGDRGSGEVPRTLAVARRSGPRRAASSRSARRARCGEPRRR